MRNETDSAAPDGFETCASPEAAVDRLEALHGAAVAALRAALDRVLAGGAPPRATERARFRYPLLRVTHAASGAAPPRIRRAWAKFQSPGIYATTITQPAAFRPYLLEQLRPLMGEFGATVEVGPGPIEIP
jgi:AMP nucleosidase